MHSPAPWSDRPSSGCTPGSRSVTVTIGYLPTSGLPCRRVSAGRGSRLGQPGARGRHAGIGAQRVWPTSVARLSQMGPPHFWIDHSNRDLLADLMNGEFEIV